MATSSDKGTPSRPLGRWDLSVMVETTRNRYDVQAVVEESALNRTERSFRVHIIHLVQSDPLGKENYLHTAHPITVARATGTGVPNFRLFPSD